jgi:hypothetical protein
MNCGINFRQHGFTITAPNKPDQTIIVGTKTGGLYLLNVTSNIPMQAYYAAQVPQNQSWYDWHKIMGHIYMGSVKMLKEKNMVEGMEVSPDTPPPQFVSCIKSKSHVTPFPQKSNTEYTETGEMTYTDIWGPA